MSVKKAGRGAPIRERKRRLSERERERQEERVVKCVGLGGLARNGADCPAELESGESGRKTGKAMRIGVNGGGRSKKCREEFQCDHRHAGGEWRCQEGTGVRNVYGLSLHRARNYSLLSPE